MSKFHTSGKKVWQFGRVRDEFKLEMYRCIKTFIFEKYYTNLYTYKNEKWGFFPKRNVQI